MKVMHNGNMMKEHKKLKLPLLFGFKSKDCMGHKVFSCSKRLDLF